MRENSTLDAHRNIDCLYVQDNSWKTVEYCMRTALDRESCLKDWIDRAWELLRKSGAFSAEALPDKYLKAQYLFWIYSLYYIYYDYQMLMNNRSSQSGLRRTGYGEECGQDFLRLITDSPDFNSARAVITDFLLSDESRIGSSKTNDGKLDDDKLQRMLGKIIYTKRKLFFNDVYNYLNHDYLKFLCFITGENLEWIKNSSYSEVRKYLPVYLWIREGAQVVVL